MADSTLWHVFKNWFLLTLSLAVLPLSTAVIAGFALWGDLSRLLAQEFSCTQDEHFKCTSDKPSTCRNKPETKTVLVTGVSMSKGLTLARVFHRSGHRVIGADFHPLSMGRVSRAIDRFYALPTPSAMRDDDAYHDDDDYVIALLKLVKHEGVDLWVSASDVMAAIHDAVAKDTIEAHTSAKAVQLGPADIMTLHEKDSFMDLVKSLALPMPDTIIVRRPSAMVHHLSQRAGLHHVPGGRQYLVKPIGVDDLARFDMPLLPLASEQETLRRIHSIPFDASRAYVMQEFIKGPEFCTHALVVRGQVRAFVACPSSALLMHYSALAPESPLSRKMLAFTKAVAHAGGPEWTGHVSFDFLTKTGDKADDPDVFPIECNPRAHTAVVLFNNTPALVDEYLAVLDPAAAHGPHVLGPENPQQYYWLGQDFVERVIYPLFEMLVLKTQSRATLSHSLRSFALHLWQWKDGTFEVWDPWPWWWLYHVYWPIQFLGYLVRGRWHRINVSTGKVFQAE